MMFIYIHLPYCLSHCIYCDFYVELKATPDRRQAYIKALQQEICEAFQSQNASSSPIETVYFGGGTPGLFSATEIETILSTLAKFNAYHPSAEITLEANPEGTASELSDYQKAGVNRLSIGVQSLQPNELKRLSRIHSRDQVYRFMEQAIHAGLSNISIDLMYGIPEQTMASWINTLEQTVTLPIQHISMYGLKVETGTALDKLMDQGRMILPEEDLTVDMYFEALSHLASHGLEAYEISNFARAGYASKHNLNYWSNGEFYGFGVSAHGYQAGIRYENPRNLSAYLENPSQRSVANPVSPQEQIENAFIFGLRQRTGLFIPDLEAHHDFNFETYYAPRLKPYIDSGHVTYNNGHLKLSEKAIPVSNEIFALFI